MKSITVNYLLPDIISAIDPIIYGATLSYFDFINWHRTCQQLWSPLSSNLYCQYLKDFTIACEERNFAHLTKSPSMFIIEEIKVLRFVRYLCNAVLISIDTIMRILKSITSQSSLQNGYKIGNIKEIFSTCISNEDLFSTILSTFERYLCLKFKLNIYIHQSFYSPGTHCESDDIYIKLADHLKMKKTPLLKQRL